MPSLPEAPARLRTAPPTMSLHEFAQGRSTPGHYVASAFSPTVSAVTRTITIPLLTFKVTTTHHMVQTTQYNNPCRMSTVVISYQTHVWLFEPYSLRFHHSRKLLQELRHLKVHKTFTLYRQNTVLKRATDRSGGASTCASCGGASGSTRES